VQTSAAEREETLHLQNQYACDSTVILKLKVLCNSDTTRLNDTITVGESYTKHGFTLPVQMSAAEREETLHLQNQYACDSTVILKLKILCNSDTTRLNDTITVGESYTKHGFTLPVHMSAAEREETLHLQNKYTCDSTVILELKVLCNSDTTHLTDSIFVGASYSQHGFTLPEQTAAAEREEILHLPNQYACDSTVILTLHVFPVAQKSICESDLPFTFGGTTFAPGTASGTYIVDEGSISMTKLELTVIATPAPPTLTSVEVCFGEANTALQAIGVAGSTITWYNAATATMPIHSGEQYTPNDTEAGIYDYFATQTINGCESEKAQTEYRIHALPAAPQLTISDNTLCDYDAEPELSVSVADESTATIRWYGTQNKTAELPTFAGEFTITANRTINPSLLYFATQTVGGCESPVSIGAEYTIAAAVAPLTTTDAAMCANETQIPALRASSTTARWYTTEVAYPSKPSEEAIAMGNKYTPEGINSTTTYYVQNEDNGCISPMTPVTMVVERMPDFTLDGDKVFCDYNTATVTATNIEPAETASSQFVWRLIGEGTSLDKQLAGNTNSITLNSETVPAAGRYTLQAVYRYSYGTITCESEAHSIRIDMHNRPVVPIAASKTVCQGAELEALQAFGSPLIQWIFKSGAQELPDWVGESYDFNAFNYSEIAIGKYEFELYDVDAVSGCESYRTELTFEIAPAADPEIVGRTELCAGASLEEMYSIRVVPEESSKYYWSTSGSTYNYTKDALPGTSVRYVDWLSTGIDTVYVREVTGAGCEGFDTLVVHIASNPVAHYTWTLPGAATTIEFMDSSYQAPIVSAYDTTAVPIQLAYTMSWDFDLLQGANSQHEDWFAEYEDRMIPVVAENYTYGYVHPKLTVSNEYGCANTYSTGIFIDMNAGVYIPNAFSPSNAAESVRIFKPIAYNLEYCKLWIYDKWGNLLYYSDEVKDGMFAGEWNGTYDGELLPSDVYIWKMEAKFLNGTTWKGQKKAVGHSKFGNVTLIR
jgi:hypothetical protein